MTDVIETVAEVAKEGIDLSQTLNLVDHHAAELTKCIVDLVSHDVDKAKDVFENAISSISKLFG